MQKLTKKEAMTLCLESLQIFKKSLQPAEVWETSAEIIADLKITIERNVRFTYPAVSYWILEF